MRRGVLHTHSDVIFLVQAGTCLPVPSIRAGSQRGHRIPGTPRHEVAVNGLGRPATRIHDGTQWHSALCHGSAGEGLLTARFTVGVRAPEPISSEKSKVPPPSGGTKDGQ